MDTGQKSSSYSHMVLVVAHKLVSWRPAEPSLADFHHSESGISDCDIGYVKVGFGDFGKCSSEKVE